MDWTVVSGDSREAIPDEEYALVLTSPPYNVGVEYDGHEDTMSLAGWRALITTVLGEAWDRLMEGGRLCVNVQHGVGRSPMEPLAFHVEGIGHNLPDAQYRGAIVWHKGPTNVTSWGSWRSPSNPVLRGTYEMVFVWSKGTMNREGGQGDLSSGAFTEATLDTWHIAAEQARDEHPAPFPVQLAERLIRLYSWDGDRVLDPFLMTLSNATVWKRSRQSATPTWWPLVSPTAGTTTQRRWSRVPLRWSMRSRRFRRVTTAGSDSVSGFTLAPSSLASSVSLDSTSISGGTSSTSPPEWSPMVRLDASKSQTTRTT